MGGQVPPQDPRQGHRPRPGRAEPQEARKPPRSALLRVNLGFRPMFCCSNHVSFGFGQVSEQDCPHLLFYGPSGSGKKTLILALIKQMFGAGSEKVHFLNINLFGGSLLCCLDFSMLRPSFGVDISVFWLLGCRLRWRTRHGRSM